MTGIHAVPDEMEAVIVRHFGGPDVLEHVHVPVPRIGPDEVLIEVAYCGVCRHDLLTRAGAFPKIGLPIIPGHQVSGRVAQVGTTVRDIVVDDRVMTMIYTGCGACVSCRAGNQAMCVNQRPSFLGEDIDGGYAQYVKVRADTIVKVSDTLTLKQAAVIVCTVGTAYHALVTRARIQAGESVVITGASGGVGIHALRVARLLGARVIAVTSSAIKRDALEAAGASEVVVAPELEFASEIKVRTGGHGADAVVDIVGARTLQASIHAVRSGGRVIVLGNVNGLAAEIRPAHFILKEIDLIGTKSCTTGDIDAAMALISSGDLAVDVGEQIPLARAADLHRRMESNTGAGRLLIEVAGERVT